MSTVFVNTSERYGDEVEVTLNDYRELNPSGEFFQMPYGIFEVVNGESIRIAEPKAEEPRQPDWYDLAPDDLVLE